MCLDDAIREFAKADAAHQGLRLVLDASSITNHLLATRGISDLGHEGFHKLVSKLSSHFVMKLPPERISGILRHNLGV